MAINVALNYDEDCNAGEKIDRKLISYVLLFCGLTGAFVGAYVDMSIKIAARNPPASRNQYC